jgi:hypothetical protein
MQFVLPHSTIINRSSKFSVFQETGSIYFFPYTDFDIVFVNYVEQMDCLRCIEREVPYPRKVVSENSICDPCKRASTRAIDRTPKEMNKALAKERTLERRESRMKSANSKSNRDSETPKRTRDLVLQVESKNNPF